MRKIPLTKSVLSSRTVSAITSPNTKKRTFDKQYGQRLDATLIGNSEIDTSQMNKDLLLIEQDLASLLKKSQIIGDQEKSKVN